MNQTSMTQTQAPAQQWRDALNAGKFLLQRDSATGAVHFPPRVTASDSAVDWIEAAGTGTVYAVTVIRPKPPRAPYNVVMVDLDEGARMMARVDGIAADQVTIGMRVRAEILPASDDGEQAALLVFKPVD